MEFNKKQLEDALFCMRQIDSISDGIERLGFASFMESSLYTQSSRLFDILIKGLCGEKGSEVIYWYLYEKPYSCDRAINEFDEQYPGVKDINIDSELFDYLSNMD